MNSQHFFTFVWLRWRLFVRQIRRAGINNAIIMGIVGVVVLLGVLLFSITAFIGGLALAGNELPREKVPTIVMYVWDGLAVGFLFMWASGLLADLQRAEALSMEKFLHLPVSLSGVFVLNYLSSLVCLTMAMFLPLMLGFGLGSCIGIGPRMLLVLPLLASFLLMVTGLSYQFQGWLAALMVNKRRRRTVVVVATLFFVILCQLPNMFNMMRFWDKDKPRHQAQQNQNQEEEAKEHEEQVFNDVRDTVRLVNLFVPPGWLALGAMAAAEGSVWPALLGSLSMGLIGAGSLWRAYRTTVRLYTGDFTATNRLAGQKAGPARAAAPARGPAGKRTAAAGNMLERQLPWLSEQAAVIALGSFRSLLRAPEAKMLLLTPVFMLFFFGFMFFRGLPDVSDAYRPFLGFGAIGFSLYCLMGFVGNQFAFDRGGFRLYVLSPAARRDILLGKNLSVAPLAVILCIMPLAVLQVMIPMRWECFLALPAQFVTMYLLFCLLANWLSLLAPMPIAAGSMKPTNVRIAPVLLNILFALLMPVALSPALVPLGIEYWLETREADIRLPIYLASSLVVCAAVVVIYRLVLSWQGSVFQDRELQILDTITTKAE